MCGYTYIDLQLTLGTPSRFLKAKIHKQSVTSVEQYFILISFTIEEQIKQLYKFSSIIYQMGNHSSSCFLLQSTCKAKLIDCKGNLRHVKLPIKAAEIMLEEPGHVISPVDELLKTHRISAMTADQELSAGKVYLFVPVSRVNGKVKRQDIDMIEAACRKKKSLKKSKKNGAKVLPAVTMNDEVKVEKEVDQVTVLGGNDTGFSGYRFGKHRQWSPVLEAISEVY